MVEVPWRWVDRNTEGLLPDLKLHEGDTVVFDWVKNLPGSFVERPPHALVEVPLPPAMGKCFLALDEDQIASKIECSCDMPCICRYVTYSSLA